MKINKHDKHKIVATFDLYTYDSTPLKPLVWKGKRCKPTKNNNFHIEHKSVTKLSKGTYGPRFMFVFVLFFRKDG